MSDTAKHLRLSDLVLFTVSAIVLLDTLAASASIGASSIFWWVFLGLIFMLPIGLITAELGTAYPEDGGLYHWIEKAFGRRWAARAIWAYWINTAIWLPAIFVLFAAVAAQLFGADLSVSSQIIIGIVLAWLVVCLEIIGLKLGKWVPNLGAMFKLVIFAVLSIGGIYFGMTHGSANAVNLSTVKPNLEDGIQFLPVIIYGMLGFELVSSAGANIQNPGRNVPKGIAISGALILALYILATLGILIAIPLDEIDIVEGLVDTLRMFFADVPGGSLIVMVLGLLTLFTFFSNAATWSMGCNRAMAEAGEERMFPAIFAKRHKDHGGPVGAAILMGVVCSVALLLYGALSSSNEDLFWNLFAFSAVIFMLPYLGMVLAFIRLRKSDPDHPRPFKVPGGDGVASGLGILCAIVLLMTMFLFAYVPGTGEGSGWQKSTIVGFVIVMFIGDILIRISPGRASDNDIQT